MSTLKVAIVGLGGICKSAHIPGWKSAKEIEFVAICDINPQKFGAVLGMLPGSPRTYIDYKEMIDKEKPDIVDICTPNYLHSEIAVYALNAGCNVLCEKPDAVSVQAIMAMAEAEKKSGKHLMVIRNNRWHFSSQELKKRIMSGEFGEIYAGRCGWIRSRGIPGKGGWFTTKAQSGGGPLIDLGVHMIDLAVYLMGNPKAVAVSGATYSKFADNTDSSNSVHSAFGEAKADGIYDVEDLAMGYIKFDNGASLQIEFSWASNIPRETNFVELRGTKKGAYWDHCTYAVYDGSRPKKWKILCDRARQLSRNGRSHTNNICHFVDVVRGVAEPDYKIEQGINMIKILMAIYESAETGKEVRLD
jgi:predicted dehydrogenase